MMVDCSTGCQQGENGPIRHTKLCPNYPRPSYAELEGRLAEAAALQQQAEMGWAESKRRETELRGRLAELEAELQSAERARSEATVKLKQRDAQIERLEVGYMTATDKQFQLDAEVKNLTEARTILIRLIEDGIERWHNADGDHRPIYQAIGLSADEYAAYVECREPFFPRVALSETGSKAVRAEPRKPGTETKYIDGKPHFWNGERFVPEHSG